MTPRKPSKTAAAKKASAPTTRRTALAVKASAARASSTGKVNGNGKPKNGNGKPKLGKGGLETLVKQYLQSHPDEQITPGVVARSLDRSGGAVLNALEKWAEMAQPIDLDGNAIGTVVQTGDRPKAFTLVTKQQARKSSRRTRKS